MPTLTVDAVQLGLSAPAPTTPSEDTGGSSFDPSELEDAIAALQTQLPTVKKMTADILRSQNQSIAVDELGFAVEAGKTYFVEYMLSVRLNHVQTSPIYSIDAPDGDLCLHGTQAMKKDAHADGHYEGFITDSIDFDTITYGNSANVPLPCVIRGTYVCRADGNLVLRIAHSGYAYGSLTLLAAQSICMYREL